MSKLSSDIALFDQEKAVYQKALIDSGYQHVLTMTERIQDNVVPSNEMSSHQIPGNNISAGEVHSTRKRRRKIMYFNPPYSCFIRNNIGKYFLNMIKTHFRQGTLLGKLFNRNNLKLSYSCCPKIKSKVSAHNKKLLCADNVSRGDVCNCRVKAECPIRGEGTCNVGSVVYKATLTDRAASMVKT